MPADLKRIEAVFHEALARTDPADRAAYLDATCAADPDLRPRVERLLAAHAELGAFLGTGAPTAATASFAGPHRVEPAAHAPDIGTTVGGRYKLLEVIGEGGMGTVYMAEQTEPVKRLVALKLIKAGMDSKAVLARFEAERQALALMDHPNIAKVLDAGTAADGRPFFVMELVKGTPITTFCDERKLTPRERLELFIPVCQAIQHAHQKGVIHRDIKPSNVLVALYDDKPVPKVIDFGIAKAAGQPLTELTLQTGYGAIVGTPEYMSPEQATFNQLDIDTRSDVYALGVLLYELLTGATPVDKARLGKAALLEVLRVVREEEAPRPSVKLSTADTRAGIAATRGTEPEKLAKLLRGELDWIVLKALEKDRNRRYDTAAGLAKDVQRYLADEMVEARPPTLGYRLRKLANRKPFIIGVIFLAALLPSYGWAVFSMLVARGSEQNAFEARDKAMELKRLAEQQKAEVERQRAEAVRQRELAVENEKKAADAAGETKMILTFLGTTVIEGQFDELFKAEPGDVTLRQALVAAEKKITPILGSRPTAEATVRYLFGTRLLVFGEAELALRQLERAYQLRRTHLGPGHEETLAAQFGLAAAALGTGDANRAVPLLEELTAVYRKKGVADHWTMTVTESLADAYMEAGKFDRALALRREIVEAHRGTGAEPAELARALHMLGRCLNEAGRPAEAEPILRESLGLYEGKQQLQSDWMRFAVAGELGASLLDQKKYGDAEPFLILSHRELKRREGRDIGKGPLVGDGYVSEAVGRLVKLYEATGQPAKAAEWRKQLGPAVAPPPRAAK